MCGVNPFGVVGITMQRRIIPMTPGRQIFLIIQLSHRQGFLKKKKVLSYLAHACEQYNVLLVEFWWTSCSPSIFLARPSPSSAIICPESQLQLKIKITIAIRYGWKLKFLPLHFSCPPDMLLSCFGRENIGLFEITPILGLYLCPYLCLRVR